METTGSQSRIAGHDARVRASDAEREQAAERLRTGHAEGRLDLDELQQRLDGCYTARTVGELDWLLSDLPPATPVAATGPGRRLAPRAGGRGWTLAMLGTVLALVIVGAVAGGGPHGHHPPVLLGLVVAALVWRATMGRHRGRRRLTGH